jgi:hypothetical protein
MEWVLKNCDVLLIPGSTASPDKPVAVASLAYAVFQADKKTPRLTAANRGAVSTDEGSY